MGSRDTYKGEEGPTSMQPDCTQFEEGALVQNKFLTC